MAEALIELRDLTRTYRLGEETIHALDGVSCTIKAGEFVAIIGPSGSGKSTLANIIGGLDTPDSGSITVAGNDLSRVRDIDLSHYRNKYVGFVFQSFNLQSHLNALENVAMPLIFAKIGAGQRRKKAEECLKIVGLEDRMHHLPTQLSGGQRQRVSIARALANDPQIIIADEPTGNLDSQKGQEIMTVLKELNKRGTTLIVITHDPSIARQAGRTLMIHDGKLTESH